MAVRNLGWYTANEGRPYPLDDAVSGLTDDGRLLPNHIIADLQLRFPNTAGQSAFISAVTVSARLVTLTIVSRSSTISSPPPWQNPVNPLDVNNSGTVTGLDALTIINYLTANGPGALPAPTGGFSPPPYYDVNGDGYVTSTDVNLIIEYLNSLGGSDDLEPNDGVTPTDDLVPLAAVSLVKPIIQGRHYPLESLYPGAGGWIVFGAGTDEDFTGRFANVTQSGLAAKAARKYTPLPIENIGKITSDTALTGLVLLKAGNDIQISATCQEIPTTAPGGDGCELDLEDSWLTSQARTTITIGLKDTSLSATPRNVFDVYRGPCSDRPESRTCGDPDPIEFINSIAPDCCGNITLEFRGCAIMAKTTHGSGVVLDCDTHLNADEFQAGACTTIPRLPTDEGVLPNEYDDQCADHAFSSASESEIVDDDGSVGAGGSHWAEGARGVPYLDTFDTHTTADSDPPDNFQVVLGSFGYRHADSPFEVGSVSASDSDPDADLPQIAWSTVTQLGLASTCLAVFADSGTWTTINKQCEVGFRLLNRISGQLHNFAVVVNYRTTDVDTAYWMIQVDWDQQKIKLLYQPSDEPVPRVIASVSTVFTPLDRWLTLTAAVHLENTVPANSATGNRAWLTGELRFGATVVGRISHRLITDFEDPTGWFGVLTDRSWVEMSYFVIDHSVP